jgi:hypothetical protein
MAERLQGGRGAAPDPPRLPADGRPEPGARRSHAVSGYEDGRPHKTEAIYRRYAIADESMLREGAVKLEALFEAQRGAHAGGHAVENRESNGKVNHEQPRLKGVNASELSEMLVGKMVGRDGIEPPTPGFSVLCSTN